MRSAPRYDNYNDFPSDWTPWEAKFLWWPKKIEGKSYWLTKVYERHKVKFLYMIDQGDGGKWAFQYQYAFNIFDLMRSENE